MKILVTGGAGFIGSHIVDFYVKQGHDVAVVDNLSSGNISNLNPEAKFYRIDIRSEKINDIFEQEKPEVVNHHAAQIDVRKSVADPIEDASINIIGTLNLLQNSVEHGVKKFLFASSGGVAYGEPEYLPADLNHPLNPLSPYGASKMSVEYYLKIYKELYGLSYAAMRYGNVYGPRQDPHGEAGVIAIFSNKILANEPLTIFGDGEQTRDYIFVDDVVEASGRLSFNDISGSFNIGTQVGSSVNELHEIFCKITGRTIDKIYQPPRAGELNRIYLKHDGDLFGWEPKTALEDGLKITFDYFKSASELKEKTV
jgi:UDP-glucose 4-epimerase